MEASIKFSERDLAVLRLGEIQGKLAALSEERDHLVRKIAAETPGAPGADVEAAKARAAAMAEEASEAERWTYGMK
jgi:hypothetical protein